MKILFVRHGEPDYGLVQSRGICGWATSFAPLTPRGRLQIDTVSRDYRLQEAEAILCSSFARALESGARLSRALNTQLFVEYDLHEWLPQKDPLGDIDAGLLDRASQDFRAGGPVDPGGVPWETLDEVRSRVLGVLRRYRRFTSLIIVTHAVVIGSLVGMDRLIGYAGIVPCDLDLGAE